MRSSRQQTLLLLSLDVLAILVTFNVVSRLRGIPQAMESWIGAPLFPPALLTIFAIYLIDGYRARTDMMSVDYTSEHILATLAAMLATLLLTFAVIPAGYPLQSSRAVIALSFVALGPLTLTYRRSIYASYRRRRGQRTLIFTGDRASYATFQEECRRAGMQQALIFCPTSDASAAPFAAAEPGQSFGNVLDRIERGELAVEAIVLRESNREVEAGALRRLVALYFAGVPTFTLELFHEVYWRKIPLYRLNPTWLFQEGFPIAREPVFERLKRACDVLLSSLGLVLAAPVMMLAGFAVWLEDRGPMFYRQTRIGRNHVPFRLVKLRTMRPSLGPVATELYTRAGDARITRVGRFLRATRIDEFPQLWNVLRGDMSLIGPRAEWDRLVLLYENEISCYHFRHLVKPGITGWAQVNYPYGASIEDTVRKLEYDLYYIRHFSFLLDATIVLKTIHIMLFGKGR